MYNRGNLLDRRASDVALKRQIIEKRGRWLNYKGTQLPRVATPRRKFFRKNNKALYEEIGSPSNEA